VRVLKRHSIENYRVDPLLVFGLLVSEGRAPSVPGVDLSAGDEHRLRDLGQAALQAVVNWVGQMMTPHLGIISGKEQAEEIVTFINGHQLKYPNWMLSRRGKDLLALYQKEFGQILMTPPRLDQMQRRIRMVPTDVFDILEQIQKS
jgi:hypothetical protein